MIEDSRIEVLKELVADGSLRLTPDAKHRDLLQACYAVRARINGEWDDPALVEFGPLSPDTTADVLAIVQKVLAPLGGKPKE